MGLPAVTIGIITYNRLPELTRTVEALVDQLHYPDLRWVIADDCSPDGYLNKVKRLKALKGLEVRCISTSERGGWGVNANHLLAQIDTDYHFFIEDDYVLTQPLDLTLGVALLETKPHLGMVRYRGTAGDHVVFHQFEADVSAVLPNWRENMGNAGRLTYLQFDGHSPSAYLYSHGAHLKHHRFHEFYGLYDEGRKLGETEEAYAVRVKSMMQTHANAAPGIVILPEWIPMKFDHIGQSYQHTALDT